MCGDTPPHAYILHRLCIDDIISFYNPSIHLEPFYHSFIAPDPYLSTLYAQETTKHPTLHSTPRSPTTKTSTSEGTRAPAPTRKKVVAPTPSNIYTLTFSETCLSLLTPNQKKLVPHLVPFGACERDIQLFQSKKKLIFPQPSDNPWGFNLPLSKYVTVSLLGPIDKKKGIPPPLPCVMSTIRNSG